MGCLNVALSYYIIPIFILIVFLFAFYKKCDAYESFIVGCKEGVTTSFAILPYLVSMYVAVRIFAASGFLQDIIKLRKMPIEFVMQGIFKPFSSNASLSFMLQIYDAYGVDSKAAVASSILQGGTDTTMYVMTLYFGSVGINKYSYGPVVGLLNDLFCFCCCIVLYFFIL